MSRQNKDQLLELIRKGEAMTVGQRLYLTILLSVPAVFAQLSSIIMQYIDASMVGRLGANDSASIGLISTTTWMFGGILGAVATGSSVQVAHLMGASKPAESRGIVRQSLVTMLCFSTALGLLGALISPHLPHWLRGNAEIVDNASAYFLIFSAGIPIFALSYLCSGLLRCAGNIKVPSMMNIMMCALDVIFNFLLIFPTHHLSVLGVGVTIPGAGLGVVGAALGSVAAETVTCICIMTYMVFRSKDLKLSLDAVGHWRPTRAYLSKLVKIGLPIGVQHTVMTSANVIITALVAPLGSVALAANSFAITAESLCYMPGYGVADAATTLVGQSIGAGRRKLTKQFAYISVSLGVGVMTVMGILMYLAAPAMMGIMTNVPDIVTLGTQILRIEAWAEPGFAAAIVCYSVFVGAGDTLVPCGMNIVSMWGVRLTLSALLVGTMGLTGVWTAMCLELCFRGLIFLVRLRSGKWIKLSEQKL